MGDVCTGGGQGGRSTGELWLQHWQGKCRLGGRGGTSVALPGILAVCFMMPFDRASVPRPPCVMPLHPTGLTLRSPGLKIFPDLIHQDGGQLAVLLQLHLVLPATRQQLLLWQLQAVELLVVSKPPLVFLQVRVTPGLPVLLPPLSLPLECLPLLLLPLLPLLPLLQLCRVHPMHGPLRMGTRNMQPLRAGAARNSLATRPTTSHCQQRRCRRHDAHQQQQGSDAGPWLGSTPCRAKVGNF